MAHNNSHKQSINPLKQTTTQSITNIPASAHNHRASTNSKLQQDCNQTQHRMNNMPESDFHPKKGERRLTHARTEKAREERARAENLTRTLSPMLPQHKKRKL